MNQLQLGLASPTTSAQLLAGDKKIIYIYISNQTFFDTLRYSLA